MVWDPRQYLKFAGPRRQSGYDLINRIPAIDAETIVDLGCGTGTLTAALAARFAEARVTGIDSSTDMLERAAAIHPNIGWQCCDIATWAEMGGDPVDLIFSNAALQWLETHEILIPKILSRLRPGGVLALQMPRNFNAPSHALMRAEAAQPRWAGRIALRVEPVNAPAAYYDLIAPLATRVDIWETEYLHILEGENPVLEWVRGTAMVPVITALDAEERQSFERSYGERLRMAYPQHPDGHTLFPFRRLFIVAVR